MFNSFTYVIYITFNLSLFIIYFFIFLFFHVYNVLNDCIFLEIIEEKLNRTGSRRAFLGSGI